MVNPRKQLNATEEKDLRLKLKAKNPATKRLYTHEELAREFGVGVATIRRYVKRWRAYRQGQQQAQEGEG